MAFVPIPTPPMVCLMRPADGAGPALKPIGTAVRRGQTLYADAQRSGQPSLVDESGSTGGFLATIDGVISSIDRWTPPGRADQARVCLKALRPGEMPVDANPAASAARAMRAVEGYGPADLPHWIDRLQRLDVSAHRIASPDLIAQLSQAMQRPIDTVICNVLDGDPRLPINAAVAAERAEEITGATAILGRLCGAKNLWMTADSALSAREIDPLIRACQKANLKLIRLHGDYPLCDPTLLLFELLKRRLRPGRLPTEQGVLLIDAAAGEALGAALLHDRPLLSVPVAVQDHARNLVSLLRIPRGTSASDLLASLKIDSGPASLRQGDLLRDLAMDAIATFDTGENLLHVLRESTEANPDPCVRCAWCVEACPTRIHPAGLLDAAQNRDLAQAERFGLEACIECGICTFVCPSRLPLLRAIRRLKAGPLHP